MIHHVEADIYSISNHRFMKYLVALLNTNLSGFAAFSEKVMKLEYIILITHEP